MDQDYCSSRGDDCEYKRLIMELTEGRELAKQLQIHLNAHSSSHETRELLIHKILTSYDKSLSILTRATGNGNGEPRSYGEMGIRRSESQRSFSGSEDSDRDSPMKKKSMHKWKQQVRVNPEKGLEGYLDDGYSWRKYGQKDILGAKYPRGYYRCAYRLLQGCFATKQVQKSNNDPNLMEITYRGRHTCNPISVTAAPTSEIQESPIPQPQHGNQLPQLPEILLNFQTGLKVMTENLEMPTCHLPSASNTKVEDQTFPPPTMLDNEFQGHMSPLFISEVPPASTFLPMSPPRMSEFDGTLSLFGAGSELYNIVSAATTYTSSPTVGLGVPFGELQFDQNFTFDSSRFSSY